MEKLEYTAHGLTFRKVSDAYVDVWFAGDSGAPFINIGIYDYATGESKVNTAAEMATKCERWYAANSGDIGSYLENHIG